MESLQQANAKFADLETPRKEAAICKKAFNELSSAITASPALAKSLIQFESSCLSLNNDSKRFLQKWKRDLHHGGAFLERKDRHKFSELTENIQEAEAQYLDNISDDKMKLKLTADELQGVPSDYLALHPPDLITGRVILSLNRDDLLPLLQFCQLQTTRKNAFLFLCSAAALTNGPVLKRLLQLRGEKARLLGYQNWAEYQLESTMMQSVGNANRFLEIVHEAVTNRAHREKEQIVGLLKRKDNVTAGPWDFSGYGDNLLKSDLLEGFDPNTAHQYFQVKMVIPALLRIMENLFCLRFEEFAGIEAWHPTVFTRQVQDIADVTVFPDVKYQIADARIVLLGRIFFDLYSREGKPDGCSALTVRAFVPGKQRAEVILCANLSRDSSACMSYSEVQTLWREFGNCVHALVAPHQYVRFSGRKECQPEVAELQGRLTELWLTDHRFYDFAINARGKPIPRDLL
ncbi:hypothetical protein QFC19_008681 [Naganishia cerealis]|uniref:Uncharacterized protein n=1 Tax=Naganishia cerealis TaxID=610337 RepID=A0ACC2UZQ3_9TREE|nr:hypothetical protein QFC19_008681 [Naganishia cerealis]